MLAARIQSDEIECVSVYMKCIYVILFKILYKIYLNILGLTTLVFNFWTRVVKNM